MATSSETKVVLSGDSSGAVKAIKETQAAFTSATTQMTAAVNPLTSAMGKFQGAAAALGGLLAGGALFKSSIDAANDWNSTVQGIAKSTGLATDKASVMAVALDHLGISSDVVSKASIAMARNLAHNEGAFTALGAQTRDLSTGAFLPAGEIMANVNTRLAGIKNITEQTIAGISVYGKSWGEVRQIIKLTAEEMAKASDRAKALGLVINPDDVARTKEYKEAQRDVSLVFRSLEIQIGEKLLPVMVQLGQWMADQGPAVANTMAAAIKGVIFVGEAVYLSLRQIGQALAMTAAVSLAVLRGNLDGAREIWAQYVQDTQKNTDAMSKAWGNLTSPLKQEETTAEKRLRLQKELQEKLGDLEYLRLVKSGAVDAAIVKNDNDTTETQIKNAEKVRDALRHAWQESIDGAKKASDEATKLLQKASDTRESGADKAASILRAQKSPEDQLAENTADFRKFSDAATENSLLAKLAAQQGRLDNAAKLADQAAKDAERAAKLTDKLGTPEEQAAGVLRVSEAQASAEEARAKIKQQDAKNLDERATAQQKTIADLDAQITALQKKASDMVIQVQIDQATSAISAIQSQLDSLQDKTVTVTVNTVQASSANGQPESALVSQIPAFARGGWTGPGSKFDPAGIVHAGEFVARSEVVAQSGALQFLSAFNQIGMAALPGFADGGLVANIGVPHLSEPAPPASRASAVFHFPDLGSYPVSMADDAMARLERNFARAALQKGGRR